MCSVDTPFHGFISWFKKTRLCARELVKSAIITLCSAPYKINFQHTINLCEMQMFFNIMSKSHLNRPFFFFISTQLFIKSHSSGWSNIVIHCYLRGSNIFSASAVLSQLNLHWWSQENLQSLKTRSSTFENFLASLEFGDVRGHSSVYRGLSRNFRDQIREFRL